MKFLCDVHISYKLVAFLNKAGYDTIHVNDLPFGSETADTEISIMATEHDRIVVTKDKDFFNSYVLKQSPAKLIRLTSGNVSNKTILNIFQKWILIFEELNQNYSFCVEINEEGIFIYKK